MPVFSAPARTHLKETWRTVCCLGFVSLRIFNFARAHSLNSQRNEQRQVIKANRVDLVTIQLNFNTPEE